MSGEIGLNKCCFFFYFYKRLERCDSVVTAWWWRTHKAYQDGMKYICSSMTGWGNQKCFPCRFLIRTNSQEKSIPPLIKARLHTERLALIACSRDFTACSSTRHPPHLQTSRPHPLRKTEQPPLFSFPPRQSNGTSKKHSPNWFCLDHLVATCFRLRTGLDSGCETCLSNVLWNCWHVWSWSPNQLVLSAQAGSAWPM